MDVLEHAGSARTLIDGHLPNGSVGLAWLGQAGFAIRCARFLVLVDPYLSDHLADKYRGTEFPHVRMMPPPVAAEELRGVTAVLCTHRHGDHMDPRTLPVLAVNNPGSCIVVPRAELGSAHAIGLPAGQLAGLNAGETLEIAPAICVSAIAAAHESLRQNERGEHHFLGYVIRVGGITVYHSGDCVVYDGLVERLRREVIDVALLPVNGRDVWRRDRGVPGNMDWGEAVELCRRAGIPWLVPHHFGMFEFNTVDEPELRRAASAVQPPPGCWVPAVDRYCTFRRGPGDEAA
jgi:L-ascorbate metabolism protein UlaG (beta-lactamase superfamily)